MKYDILAEIVTQNWNESVLSLLIEKKSLIVAFSMKKIFGLFLAQIVALRNSNPLDTLISADFVLENSRKFNLDFYYLFSFTETL